LIEVGHLDLGNYKHHAFTFVLASDNANTHQHQAFSMAVEKQGYCIFINPFEVVNILHEGR